MRRCERDEDTRRLVDAELRAKQLELELIETTTGWGYPIELAYVPRLNLVESGRGNPRGLGYGARRSELVLSAENEPDMLARRAWERSRNLAKLKDWENSNPPILRKVRAWLAEPPPRLP